MNYLLTSFIIFMMTSLSFASGANVTQQGYEQTKGANSTSPSHKDSAREYDSRKTGVETNSQPYTEAAIEHHKVEPKHSKTFLLSVFFLILALTSAIYLFVSKSVGISLSVKLVGGILSLIVVMVALIVVSVRSIQGIGTEIKSIAEEKIPLTTIATHITEYQLQQEIHFERYLRTGDTQEKNLFIALGKKVTSEVKRGEAIAERWVSSAEGSQEKTEAKKMLERLKNIEVAHLQFERDCEKVINMNPSDQGFKSALEKCEHESEQIENNLFNFLSLVEKKTAQAAFTAEQHEVDSENYLFTGGIAATVFGMLILLVIWQASVGLVNSVKVSANSLLSSSSNISSSATQFKGNSETLASMTQQQAAGVQEMMSTIDEVNAMTTKNSEQASFSATKAENCKTGALNGQKSINDVMLAIQDINRDNNIVMEQIKDSNSKISEISNIISDISEKTNVINEIVFQTKLLSFNASVEAARAGEQGKGFAVVAEEVGNLAQMSGDAATEISDMLTESISKVRSIVDESSQKADHLMQTSKSKVQAGLDKVSECNQIFTDVVKDVSDVDKFIAEIAAATKEQSDAVDAISTALREIDTATQEISTVSQEAARASESLSNESDNLQENSEGLMELVSSDKGRVEAA